MEHASRSRTGDRFWVWREQAACMTRGPKTAQSGHGSADTDLQRVSLGLHTPPGFQL